MIPKILVIEDDQPVARMIREVLTREGYQVKIGDDGPRGLKIAEVWQPHLILLDVMLPRMNGIEICRTIRGMDTIANVPIIMLTSKMTLDAKAAAFEAGADDYITKPFDNEELALRVAAQLRRMDMLAGSKEDHQGWVITVFSLRGGAGCSSLAANLAIGLRRLWDVPVALVDLGLPTGLCDLMLNLKTRGNLGDLTAWTLTEVDPDLIDSCLTQHTSGVDLLGGILSPLYAEMLSEDLIRHVLGYLRERYSYIVVDTAHSFAPPVLAALDYANRILMPLTPDINSARLAVSALRVFDDLDYEEDKIRVIVNEVFPDQKLSVERLENSIEWPVSMVIPHTRGVWTEAINSGKPVITGDPASPAVASLEDLTWLLASPAGRRQQPSRASAMWQRVVRRAKQRIRQSQAQTSRAS